MAKLMAAGKAKREKLAEPVSDKEVSFQLPPGWAWCRLVDAGQFINGLAFKPSDWGRAGRPIIRIQNLSGRNLDFNRTTGSFDPAVLVQDGDILVSWSATLDAFIWRGEEGVLNQHIFRVLPSPLADKGYLFWLLKWVIRQLANSDHAHGLVMSHINRGPFLAYPIPLPPFAEQKRIVAKLDELMALCDQMESQQEEREVQHGALTLAALARFAEAPTPANLSLLFHRSYEIAPADFRKSILALAVQGKIVPRDQNNESVEELLAEMEIERRCYAEARNLRPSVTFPVDAPLVPFAVPATWKWCRLNSLFNVITDGDHLPPPKAPDGIAFLTIGNITTGRLDFEGSRFVPDSYYRALADFRRPARGDILYTVVGATYGRPALVETNRPFCVQRHIAILKPSQRMDAGFLMVVLRSPLVYEQATSSKTGTAQPTIPLGSLRNFMVPLPPLAEQHRIVAKVEELMELVDELEAQLATARSTAAKLLDALVAELLLTEL